MSPCVHACVCACVCDTTFNDSVAAVSQGAVILAALQYAANTLRKHVDIEIRCPPFIESLSLDYDDIIFIRSHLRCRLFSAANGSLVCDVAIYVGIVVEECLRVYG